MPKKREADSGLEALTTISPQLQALAELALTHLGAGGFSEITVSVSGPEEVAGSISLRTSADGPLILIEGKLGGAEPDSTPGIPYVAPYEAGFYLKPSPSEAEFFKSGDAVEEGAPVGVLMVGKFKIVVKAEQAGRIHYRVENGDDVETDDVLYTIEGSQKDRN